ncbi:MAG: V-type ATPase subunit [Conexivisphaerales archaeon]
MLSQVELSDSQKRLIKDRYLRLSKLFLKSDFMVHLNSLSDSAEIEEALSTTWYRDDVEAASSLHRPPISIDVALNRHIVELNRIAINVVPEHGKKALLAYLSRWDIEDILLILAAKSLGRRLEETEPFIVSPRNLPVGIAGNVIPYSVMKMLLEQKDVESVIKELVRYRYGAILLQHLREFERTADLGIFEGALLNDYYARLQWELRFYKGDEGALREYFRAEITKRNLLTLLKSKDSQLSKEVVARHILSGGFLDADSYLAAYDTNDMSGIYSRLKPFMDVSRAVKRYQETRNMAEFEVEIDNLLIENYFWRFRMHDPLSVTGVFFFLIRGQFERENIRRITYGKEYGLPVGYINSILLRS